MSSSEHSNTSDIGTGIRIDNFTIQAKISENRKPPVQKSYGNTSQRQHVSSVDGENTCDVDEIVNRCIERMEQRLEWYAER